MAPETPGFGVAAPGAECPLRPGGYAAAVSAAGEVAAVVTPRGLMLPGGGQQDGKAPGEAAVREVEEECGRNEWECTNCRRGLRP